MLAPPKPVAGLGDAPVADNCAVPVVPSCWVVCLLRNAERIDAVEAEYVGPGT